MIVMHNIERVYETEAGRIRALRRINLEVRFGEFVTFVGPCGAGKSTLLAIIGMLDRTWGGEYDFLGEAVHRLSDSERLILQRRSIGLLLQHHCLIDGMTVAENLDLALSCRDIGRARRRKMAAEALDRFQLGTTRNLYPFQLSGGQLQLVALARAAAGNPRVILADEPVGALGSDQGRTIMEPLAALNREGMAIVQATRRRELAAFGRRIVELRNGSIVCPADAPGGTERLPVTVPSWKQAQDKGATIGSVDR